MLKWLSINKDAMIALAALVSPLIAILGGLVSSVVSYRAVVTGPRIQREIADRQFRLTSSQMTASLFGAADHKWIDDFRETFSLLLSLINERGSIIAVVRQQEGKPLLLARQLEISQKVPVLMANLRLMVGPSDSAFLVKLAELDSGAQKDMASVAGLVKEVYDMAFVILDRRYMRIAGYVGVNDTR